MATVNQVFQSAPMGRRVYLTSALSFAVVLVVFIVNLYVVVEKLPQHVAFGARALQALGPFVALLFIVPSFLYERHRTSKISIENNVLVTGRKRYPLEGVVDVARDPDVLKRARKRIGNGGLGAIRGKFVSKRLGKFDAFLTGTENAVVLKWTDKAVAVSPSDPEFFIYSARSAAGLS